MCAFLCSTYTEQDYDVIWENYMYISQDNWWVVYDFGKKNCSEARPRRADVTARLEELWVDRVKQLSQPAGIVLPNPSRIGLGASESDSRLADWWVVCNPERKCFGTGMLTRLPSWNEGGSSAARLSNL